MNNVNRSISWEEEKFHEEEEEIQSPFLPLKRLFSQISKENVSRIILFLMSLPLRSFSKEKDLLWIQRVDY